MAEDRLKKPYYPDVHLYKTVAQDKRLSLETRGLYVMMMSLPDDWEFCVGGLASVAGCGKDRIRRLLGELEEVGYLLREQSHDAGGKFAKNTYVLQSFAPPLSGNPDNGKHRRRGIPSSAETVGGNPDTKEYVSNINISPHTPQGGRRGKMRKAPRDAPDWKPERFAGFWEFYPSKGRRDKQRAMDAWDKLEPDDDLIKTIARALVKLKETDEWKRGVAIPHVATFLNNARWKDAEEVEEAVPEMEPGVERKSGWD